jgi:hypothetical protein
MSFCPNGPVARFLFCLLATAQPASAKVTGIEFTSKQPYGTFYPDERGMRGIATLARRAITNFPSRVDN